MLSSSGNNSTFDSVQDDVTELIEITCKYLQQLLPYSFRERLVYNSYNPALSQYRDHFFRLHLDDIAQQIKLTYFTVLNKYFKNSTDHNPQQFRIQLNYQVTWVVRDWMVSQLRKLYREDLVPILPGSSPKCHYFELNLGPAFLVKGSSVYPYSTLSNYDRLLIHLAFYEDMNDSEIGRTLQRDRIMVRRDLDRILDYLRSCYERKS